MVEHAGVRNLQEYTNPHSVKCSFLPMLGGGRVSDRREQAAKRSLCRYRSRSPAPGRDSW